MKYRFAIIAAATSLAMILGVALWWSAGGSATERRETPKRAVFVAAPEAQSLPLDRAEAAAKRAPGDPRALANLGNTYLKARRFQDAAATYERAVTRDAKNAALWSALGEARMQTQQSTDAHLPPGAREAFDRALALDPREPRSRFYKTMEKDFLGKHDEAIGEWLQLLREMPVGSQADEAIRTAIAASVQRNTRLIAKAVQEAGQVQPRRAPTGQP